MTSDEDEFRDRRYPVSEYMTAQRRHWRVERIGWVVFLLVVLAALAGLFSQGPLSHSVSLSADGRLRIEYQRFERNGASARMHLQLRGEPGQLLQLDITGDLLDKFHIETLHPEPAHSRSFDNGLRLLLLTDPSGQASLHLALRGAAMGTSRSRFVLGGSPPLGITQFIYP